MTKWYLPLSKRLESNSIPEPSSGCLLWTGAILKKGYGTINVNGKNRKAHRVAWENQNGPIPNGMHVLHRCDTPCCIELNHLFLGTDKDNRADCVAKGRHYVMNGEKHPRSKLTKKDVLSIRASSSTEKALAREYGVSKSLISKIRCRVVWTHLEE